MDGNRWRRDFGRRISARWHEASCVGVIIHIYVTDAETRETVLVWEGMLVEQVFDGSGIEIIGGTGHPRPRRCMSFRKRTVWASSTRSRPGGL